MEMVVLRIPYFTYVRVHGYIRSPFYLFSILAGMRNFLVQSIIFFFFLVAFICLGIISWATFAPYFLKKNIVYSPAAYGHMYSRIKDVNATENVDILFIGSSTCYRGFDTRIFQQQGYRSFNLGSSNQTHLQSEVLLKQYLSALHPKLVVYEVTPGVLETDGVESALDLISNNKIDFSVLHMALCINSIKVYNSLLYAYVKQAIGGAQNLSEPVQRETSTYVRGGYEEKPMRYFKNDSVFAPRNYVVKNEQLKAFYRNLQFLHDSNTPYILVQAPNTRAVYNSIQNARQIDSLYHTCGTYFNFNTAHGFVDTLHFYDRGHLNQQGVILFNQKFIALLHQLKIE
jgi:hypothetical protein